MLRELLSFASGRAFRKAKTASSSTVVGESVRRLATVVQEVDNSDRGFNFFPYLTGDSVIIYARIPNFRHIIFGIGSDYFSIPQTARTAFEKGAIDFSGPLPSPLTLEVRGFEFRVVNGVCYVDEMVYNLPRVRGVV